MEQGMKKVERKGLGEQGRVGEEVQETLKDSGREFQRDKEEQSNTWTGIWSNGSPWNQNRMVIKAYLLHSNS